VKRPPKRASEIWKRASEGDASEMAGSVLKSPEARFLNFEARFSSSFLDALARIKLRGFEAGGGGGKLLVTLGLLVGFLFPSLRRSFLFLLLYEGLAMGSKKSHGSKYFHGIIPCYPSAGHHPSTR
jgi:hypothetical protein